MKPNSNHSKIAVGLTIGLLLGVASAAAKAYVDVEKLKDRFEIIMDLMRETRQDVKEIKTIIIRRENR